MPLEIERKFLLTNNPLWPKPDEVIQIQQYYCSSKSEPNFRIRKSTSDNGTIYTKTTKKKIGKGTFEEIEVHITKEDFEKYLKKAKSCIMKLRYVKKVGKLKWEIDTYKNIRLVTAEIELPDIDHPIKIPKFISDNLIMEVTDMKQFSNKSLSQPFKP